MEVCQRMITSFAQLGKFAKEKESVNLALVAPYDGESLSAVMHAKQEEIAEPILVGEKERVRKTAKSEGLDISGAELIDCPPGEEALTACRIASDGSAGALMKGKVSTGSILRALLDKRFNLRGSDLLSHIILLENPNYPKLFLISDAAMVVAPTLSDKVAIIKNAVSAMHRLGVEKPKVAMVAAIERVNYEHMPATVDAAIIAQMGRRGQLGNCEVDGPFGFDNAISAESARIKGVVSPVAGDADIFILPDIEAGNILYKALMFLSPTKSAGIVVGAKVPVVLLSRADNEECKFYSIAMASVCS